MPKGRVEPRAVICRACESEFISDRIGKAALYCHREECDAARAAAPKPPRKRKPSLHRPGPLSEDLAVVLRLADEIGASPKVLKETVMMVARGQGDMRFLYRRLAAVSLALAAYVGGRTV